MLASYDTLCTVLLLPLSVCLSVCVCHLDNWK